MVLPAQAGGMMDANLFKAVTGNIRNQISDWTRVLRGHFRPLKCGDCGNRQAGICQAPLPDCYPAPTERPAVAFDRSAEGCQVFK